MPERETLFEMYNRGLDEMIQPSVIAIGLMDAEARAQMQFEALGHFPEHELRAMLAICLDRLAVIERGRDVHVET